MKHSFAIGSLIIAIVVLSGLLFMQINDKQDIQENIDYSNNISIEKIPVPCMPYPECDEYKSIEPIGSQSKLFKVIEKPIRFEHELESRT